MTCYLVVCCTSRTRGSGLYVSDLEKEANRFLKQDELGLSTFGKVGIAFGTIFILLVALLLQRVYCPYRSGLTTFKIIFFNIALFEKNSVFIPYEDRGLHPIGHLVEALMKINPPTEAHHCLQHRIHRLTMTVHRLTMTVHESLTDIKKNYTRSRLINTPTNFLNSRFQLFATDKPANNKTSEIYLNSLLL